MRVNNGDHASFEVLANSVKIRVARYLRRAVVICTNGKDIIGETVFAECWGLARLGLIQAKA